MVFLEHPGQVPETHLEELGIGKSPFLYRARIKPAITASKAGALLPRAHGTVWSLLLVVGPL